MQIEPITVNNLGNFAMRKYIAGIYQIKYFNYRTNVFIDSTFRADIMMYLYIHVYSYSL